MSEETTIYMVRHGETAWNVEKRLQGHADSPLTELGERQAAWLGEALRNEPIEAAYASSSGRACRTAEIIRGDCSYPIVPADELREIRLGIWEGLTQDEAKARDPEPFDHFWHDPERFAVEGSETFSDVWKRAADFVAHAAARHAGRSLLLVTHTVVVKVLMAAFEGRPIHALWEPPYIHPACLNKVVLRGNVAQILLHGDISHYREASSWG